MEKYENKSSNQQQIIQRNGARLSFDCTETVIKKDQAGKDKNSMK